MPNRSGTPSTRSTPLACSSKIRSIVLGPSRRMPSTSPPSEMADRMRPTERAFPCPLQAPMSACRQPAVLAAAASATGPVKVLNAGLCGSMESMSNGSGGGGTTSAMRSQSRSSAPIWKSAPSGPATSSATNRLSDFPVILRTISPTMCPWLSAWYPDAVPGSHHGAWLASCAVDLSQSYMSRVTNGCSQPDTPEVCARRCLTSMSCLPLAAYSGQYLAIGAYTSSWPRSASIRAARFVTVFVDDQTLVMVSFVHGVVLAS